jgi:universal stress protein E
MQQLHSILYVAGQEPVATRALERAVDLARRNDAHLTLAHGDLTPEQAAAWERRVRQDLDASDLEVVVKALEAPLHVAIVREVLASGHDAVMKTPTAEHGLLPHLHSGVDDYLLRECPCLVWLDRPSDLPSYRRILAAVDPGNEDAPDLEPRILEIAASQAALERTELHVAHAWRLVGEKHMRGRVATAAAAEEVDEAVEEEETAQYARLEELCLPLQRAGAGAILHLVKGMPQAVIPDLVADLEIDLLVLGTVARHGVAGLLMGNTAEGILDRVLCSVLAVKPQGFRSSLDPAG